MWTYDAQAERRVTRNRSADYTDFTRYVDAVLSNGTMRQISDLKYALYTAVQSGPGDQQPGFINRTISDAVDNADVASNLLLPLSFYHHYGFEKSVQAFAILWRRSIRVLLAPLTMVAYDRP